MTELVYAYILCDEDKSFEKIEMKSIKKTETIFKVYGYRITWDIAEEFSESFNSLIKFCLGKENLPFDVIIKVVDGVFYWARLCDDTEFSYSALQNHKTE